MAMDTTCLFSTVRNISGGTKTFSFLPPHGKELDNNEELTVFGDIREAVNRGDRYGSRWMDALEAACEGGDLEIVNTPAAILEDETSGDIKMITLDGGSLVLSDPCWETSLTI